MTLASPIPKNLKQQVLAQLQDAPEADLVLVHETLLHARKLRLLDEISEDAEQERADGKWDNLPELLTSFRAKLRGL
jgi:hypothetical protein